MTKPPAAHIEFRDDEARDAFVLLAVWTLRKVAQRYPEAGDCLVEAAAELGLDVEQLVEAATSIGATGTAFEPAALLKRVSVTPKHEPPKRRSASKKAPPGPDRSQDASDRILREFLPHVRGSFTSQEVADALDINRTTALRGLKKLEAQGYVVNEGRKKGSKWRRAPDKK